MKIETARNLACPLDASPLSPGRRQLVCAQGHSFDIARQGYVNLLPVQFKRSRQPGDSQSMVAARSRFLNTGAFAPIAERLAELATTRLAGAHRRCLLDAGCGEGYYLDFVAGRLASHPSGNAVECIGMDISKAAVLAAARRNKHLSWVVGTNRRPPVLPASVDLLFCVFGFPVFDAFERLLKPGGRLVLVDAGRAHLRELREIVYAEVRESPPPAHAAAQQAGFRLLDSQPLGFTTGALDNLQIKDLLMMTPHFHRARRAAIETAAAVDRLAVSVDVLVRVLEKPP